MSTPTATNYTMVNLEALHRSHGAGMPPGGLQVQGLRPQEINLAPGAFQIRDSVENAEEIQRHIDALTAHLRGGGTLEAVLVTPIAGEWWLVDGHCRMAAYRNVGWATPVPVRVTCGGPEQALLESLHENLKQKLNVTPAEKRQVAWAYLLRHPPGGPDSQSVRWIGGATGVPWATVQQMSKRLQEAYPRFCQDPVNATARPASTWEEEKKRRRGDVTSEWTTEMRNEALERDAARLRREWGRVIRRRPDYFADVIRTASPRVWGVLLDEARAQVEEEAEAEGDWTGDEAEESALE